MNPTAATRLALNPQYCLKNDVDRAVLVTRPQPLSYDESPAFRLLHPKEAVLLSLFDGDRTVRDVTDVWTDLSGRPAAAAAADVDGLVRFYATGEAARRGFLLEVDERNRKTVRQYDPMDFVIPAGQVNLEDPRFRKPYTVCFMPTLFCPQKCVYCHAKLAPQPEEERISLKRLQTLFAEMRQIGVEVIRMTGGDPFARKDIFDILEAVFEEGMVPDVPTKLGLTWYEALRLKDLGVKLVQVGLDTTDPTVLDRMAGVKGYHHRVFRLFDNLRRAGLSVRVSTVLTPMNVPTVGLLIDYLGGLGNVARLTITPYARSLFCHRDELFLAQEEYGLVEQQVKERVTFYPQMKIVFRGPAPAAKTAEEQERRWRERPLCSANRHGFVILPDGRVTVCEELYDHPAFLIGDLKRQSVMEMWTSPRALALLHPDRSEVPDGACRTCSLFAECNRAPGRCWRDVLKAYGWNRPHYPDPRCPLAPAGNRLN